LAEVYQVKKNRPSSNFGGFSPSQKIDRLVTLVGFSPSQKIDRLVTLVGFSPSQKIDRLVTLVGFLSYPSKKLSSLVRL
jgi:hypothetical protein